VLGWEPTVSLQEGLVRTLEWLRLKGSEHPDDSQK
jgi:nucleoside-diphosphate-sugar epimerase